MKSKRLKILVVGSSLPGAIENYYRTYLDKEVFEVLSFNPSLFYKIHSIRSKISFRYFPQSLFRSANKQLINYARQVKPDIIWVFKGVEFFPGTLRHLKGLGINLINYNPDHPFIRTLVSNGGRNIKDCIPYYDLHFCYSRDLVHQLKTDYNLNAAWLPFGFELSDEEYSQIPIEGEIHKVCFIGNPDALRAKWVKRIAAEGIPIDVFGYNWSKYLNPGTPNINFFNQVNGFEYWETLRKYRVQLNIFRPHNVNSHNMRTFEIPACGGIQLAPASEEHAWFFKENSEIFLYHSEEDAMKKIKLILNMTSTEAALVRNAARNRVLNDDYSYAQRAKQAGEAILRIT
jgi:spore maturation protein CgeB